MFRIPGYEAGANITVLNTIYHKPTKNPETGKYGKDSIDIIFKDLDTGEKHLHHIDEPEYTYYIANDDCRVPYNRLFISKEDCFPVTCKYREVLKDIAEKTGNLDRFYDNIRSGNYKANDGLIKIPSIFNADMHIEDYYRFKFGETYKNEQCEPGMLFFDIEVDGTYARGDFPEPGECPVNALSIIDDINKKVVVYVLINEDNPLIDKFMKENHEKELKEFVKEKVGGYKEEIRFGLNEYDYKIIFFREEIALINNFFGYINFTKPDFALAWNIAFDLPYLLARIQVLGYDPVNMVCHKDFPVKECWYYVDKRADKFEERGDYGHISCYTVYLDQLITFASRRKGQKKGNITRYTLDFIGSIIAGVRKLEWKHICKSIKELPYADFKTFIFYNVMDTIVQLCIERKVGDISFVFGKSLAVSTRYAKIHRQTVYLFNKGVTSFSKMGFVMGNNVNKNNVKVGFPGAFVADPKKVSDKIKMRINDIPINVCNNLDDFDYTALYPSIIDENNMAPNTQYGRVIFPEPFDSRENRFNNRYFHRTVWFMEDMVSGDYITFCERYLHLAGYMQMYYDIIEYFRTIQNPLRGLRNYDVVSGKRFMTHYVNNQIKKPMCAIVDDNSYKREMCRVAHVMPKWGCAA